MDSVKCNNCGYSIIKPYPKDQLCPRCGRFLTNLFENIKEQEESKPKAKQFATRTVTLSKKLGDKIKVKKKDDKEFSLYSEKIDLKKGEYIKLLGITSKERIPLYCSNNKYVYLLELSNNLDFISNRILGGSLDKMLLVPEQNDQRKEEKCQFYEKSGVIYLAYGKFPDKKGKWILEQMSNHYSDLLRGKDVNNLEDLEKKNFELQFQKRAKYILTECRRLKEVFSDQVIPYLEDKLRIDYLGFSSKSIGVISLIIGEDELNIEIPGNFENPEEALEMKESVLTANIEALAANTLGNTGAVPRWISVKLGFQNYRFITFKKFRNNYFLSLLSEGNLDKLGKAENRFEPFFEKLTESEFTGNLKLFNSTKLTLKEFLSETREFF
jgi:hypothetical protein